MNLLEAFAGRRNCLNAFRLALASLVVMSHSWMIGGYGPEPSLGGIRAGNWAVLGFFAISGYLITMSRQNHERAFSFYRARFLRIMPGLGACLVLIAFVFAPLSAVFTGRNYSLIDAVLFVLRHITLWGSQPLERPFIGETLSGLPYPNHWNIPLWSLLWEVLCYLIIGHLITVLRPGLVRLTVWLLFLAGTVGIFVVETSPALRPFAADWPIVPVTTFLAGSLVFLYQHRIPSNLLALGVCSVLLALAVLSGLPRTFLHLPLAAVLIIGSLWLPLHRVGAKFDISYGVYIYGWPVQQLLVLAGLHTAVPVSVFVAACLAAVVPFAFLSCILVERPSQRLGRRFRKQVPQRPAMPVSP